MADNPPAPPPSVPPPLNGGSQDLIAQLQQRLQSSGNFQMGNQSQQGGPRSQSKSLRERRPVTLRVGQYLEALAVNNGYKLHFLTTIHEAKGLIRSEPLAETLKKFGISKEGMQEGREIFHTFKFTARSTQCEGGGQLEVGKIYIIVGSEVPAHMASTGISYMDFAPLAIYPQSMRDQCLNLLF